MVCYQPFWNTMYDQYLSYDHSGGWRHWFDGHPTLMVLWGIAILYLNLIYMSASVAFGLRFSNLTYRGLISSGPYRWTKHPAYLSKNLTWWLLAMPFLSHEGWETALRCSIMLAGINIVYYLRARTEEAHLSHYPEYREYAAWVNEHGIFTRNIRKIQRLLLRIILRVRGVVTRCYLLVSRLLSRSQSAQ